MFDIIEGDVTLRSGGVETAVGDALPLPVGTRGYINVGYDGTNTRFIRVDGTGRTIIVGADAPGAAATANPVVVGGVDIGGFVRQFATDTSGRQRFVGAADNASPVAGSPVLVGGSDGTNVYRLLTDAAGRLQVTIAGGGGGGTASTFGAVFPPDGTASGFSDGTNMQGARVHDLDTGGGTEFNLGMSLRLPGAGGSVAGGTQTNPIRTDPTGTTIQPVDLSSWIGSTAPTVGQKTKAASLPVALASDQILASTLVNEQGVILPPTAFNETRVAAPYTLADHIHKYGIDTNTYSTQTATGGTVTHIPNHSAVRTTVTGTSGSTARIRTNTFYRYQAGKGLRWRITGYHSDTGQSNQVRRWGFHDDSDGLFFGLTGTTLQIVQRSSASGSIVDTAINQASWNYDKMDGTGPSGTILDITKGNIYECSFAWLGVGDAHFYINEHLVHIIQNVNTYAAPYMKTAQLPINVEVLNTGVSSAGAFTYICSSVIVEGGGDPPVLCFGAFNPTDVVTTTVERPLLSIRPKLTINSITNRALIIPHLLMVSCESGRSGFRLAFGTTSLTGASWTSVDADSGTEFDVSATAGSGGNTLLRGFLANTTDSSGPIPLEKFFSASGQARKLRLDAFGTIQPIITIYGINEAAGSTNMRASLSWGEVR